MKYLVSDQDRSNVSGRGVKVGIVVARYNWDITGEMVQYAWKELVDAHVAEDDINVVTVPGAYELATVARALIASAHYDVLICFGCVLKGETRHDVLVGDAAAWGIQKVSLDTGVPIVFGVVCAENQKQAQDRIYRGKECAMTALELVQTLVALKQQHTVVC